MIELAGNVVSDRTFVDSLCDTGYRKDGLDLSREYELTRRFTVEKRPDAEMVAGAEEFFFTLVPDGEGKITE